jgi:hypothetical protein
VKPDPVFPGDVFLIGVGGGKNRFWEWQKKVCSPERANPLIPENRKIINRHVPEQNFKDGTRG